MYSVCLYVYLSHFVLIGCWDMTSSSLKKLMKRSGVRLVMNFIFQFINTNRTLTHWYDRCLGKMFFFMVGMTYCKLGAYFFFETFQEKLSVCSLILSIIGKIKP